MKKCCLLMGAAAASLAGIASADTVATVLIDGQTYEMASFMVDGEFRLVPAIYTFGDTTVEALETPRATSAAIAYGVAVIDFGAASSFSFTFTVPMALDPGATTVTSSIVGGMTDFGGDGVSVSTTGGFTTLQRSWVDVPTTDLGVDVGPSLAFGPGGSGSLYNYGAYSAGPVAGGDMSGFVLLSTQLDFLASGGSDVIVMTGFTDIVVPAPASIALLGGLGLIARRRR